MSYQLPCVFCHAVNTFTGVDSDSEKPDFGADDTVTCGECGESFAPPLSDCAESLGGGVDWPGWVDSERAYERYFGPDHPRCGRCNETHKPSAPCTGKPERLARHTAREARDEMRRWGRSY